MLPIMLTICLISFGRSQKNGEPEVHDFAVEADYADNAYFCMKANYALFATNSTQAIHSATAKKAFVVRNATHSFYSQKATYAAKATYANTFKDWVWIPKHTCGKPRDMKIGKFFFEIPANFSLPCGMGKYRTNKNCSIADKKVKKAKMALFASECKHSLYAAVAKLGASSYLADEAQSADKANHAELSQRAETAENADIASAAKQVRCRHGHRFPSRLFSHYYGSTSEEYSVYSD